MRNEILAGSFAAVMKHREAETLEQSHVSGFIGHVQRLIYSKLVLASTNNSSVQFEDIDLGEDNVTVGGSKKKPALKLVVPVRHKLEARDLDNAIVSMVESAGVAGIDNVKVRSTEKAGKDEEWNRSEVELKVNPAVYGMDTPDDGDENTADANTLSPMPATPATQGDHMTDTANKTTVVEKEPAGKILPNPHGEGTGAGGAAVEGNSLRGTESENRTVSEVNPDMPGGKGAAQKALEMGEEQDKAKSSDKSDEKTDESKNKGGNKK